MTADPTMVRRALAMLPARCPYHDEVYDERQRGRFRTGLGACCETGEPALLRRLAEDAMSRICGDETPGPNAMLRRG